MQCNVMYVWMEGRMDGWMDVYIYIYMYIYIYICVHAYLCVTRLIIHDHSAIDFDKVIKPKDKQT